MAPVLPVPESPIPALRLPPGFGISVFARNASAGAEYFRGPRFMAFGPDGNLYLSLGRDNKVVMLPDRNKDGLADAVVTVAENLNAPQGLAFVDGKLFVANQDGVVRLEQKNGRWPASGVIPVISGLPAGGHTLKSLKLGPDGFLYLNVGSSCNVCIESDPLRATILRYTVEGKAAGHLVTVGRHAPSPIWAEGLRNAQGFAWHPVTGALYATNNGADMRSNKKGGRPVDDLPPEHLNRIEPGKHYGWPHCWGEQVADPNFSGPEGFCARTQPPAFQLPAHATPIGITFLDKAAFPVDYRNDALVALHGSWNRNEPAGYKVIRVHFEDGKPVSTSDFIAGWLLPSGAWGRPVDVAMGPDGAVYLSDDRAGIIYRITYQGAFK
jgi:glucose/arabinose dehydrogenase